LRTNEDRLVEMAVQGSPIYPRFFGWEVSHQGNPLALPSVGGIVYNVKVGDSVYGLMGDHIEPAVSATASHDKLKDNPNSGFNALSCVGNEVRLISGEAKGATGMVVGHHGGVEHVMIDFPQSALEKMSHDDKLLIRCFGLGLKLLDFPDISLYGTSPKLLHGMGLRFEKGRLVVPVAAKIPAVLMGSGLGSAQPFKGDYDMQTSDPRTLEEHGLTDLRFGDIVAIIDHQCHYGYAYLKGAVTIGVVVHSDSFLAGHGPGVQALFTTQKKDLIIPELFEISSTQRANVGHWLGIGRWRKKK
jgi:hypothetical protein